MLLLWGLDLKHRSQIRKIATGLEQSEELPGRGRGSPFIAGTSLLSTTLKAGLWSVWFRAEHRAWQGRWSIHIYYHTQLKVFISDPAYLCGPPTFTFFSTFLPSEPSLFSSLLSFCPYTFPHCWLLQTSSPFPCLPSHALRPWLSTTQCSTPLMTDVSDCCLLSERFYTYSLTST